MEDAHIISSIELPSNETGLLAGVFDGHGGKDVAIFVKENLERLLVNLPEFHNEKYDEALKKCIMFLD